ncbi:MAG: putative thioesterase [Bacteroidota bacterium]|jgi:acyl-CoA thioester hydrolase
MFSLSVEIRVRYAETDQMGYVYYGNYATYFEVARVEAMRSLGISYKELEARGVMMPVLEYKSKYIRPAKYDDLLKVTVNIKQKPTTRILFDYEVHNQEGTLLNVGETTLVFIDTNTGRPCKAPDYFNALMDTYFSENE